MFTVKQTAALLGVSSALVYALLAAGKIRHERHGLKRGTIRIPQEAIDEYRKGCTVDSRSATERELPPQMDTPRPACFKHFKVSRN